LGQRNTVLFLVYNSQYIAGMDQLTIDGIDLLYLSIDPGAQSRNVSVNLRVIRIFIEN
jgi:hypothetical protein